MEDEIKSVDAQEPVTDNSDVIADILRAAAIEDGMYEEEESAQVEDQESIPEPKEEPEETTDNPVEEAGKDKPYTVEELIEMGKSESMDKLDTSRIPPELQPVYKSLQAMSTRRQQTLAEKEKELEARLAQVTNTKEVSQPRPIEQRVYSDPVGVMQEINSKIAETNAQLHKAQEADDIFEVQKLLIQKDTLKDQYLAVQGIVTAASRETESVYKAIPNFQEKAPKLVSFVNEVLGDNAFTQSEISWLTNPLVTGKMSTKLVHLINAVYEMKEKQVESAKTVEEKLKKVKPSKGLSPGSSDIKPVDRGSAALLKRAQTTRDDIDMAEYIAAITSKG